MISYLQGDMVVAFMKDVLTAAVDASGDRREEVLSAIIEAIDRHNPGSRHWWGQNEIARPLMDLQAEYNNAVKHRDTKGHPMPPVILRYPPKGGV